MLKYVLTILSITTRLACAVNGDIVFRATANHQDYSIGEPIVLTLVMENRGDAMFELDLGANGVENIQIVFTHNGIVRNVKGYVHGGVSKITTLSLLPGVTATHAVFFQDFAHVKKTGKYDLSIQLPDSKIRPAKVSFSIWPDTEESNERLRQRYAIYIAMMQSADTSLPDRELIHSVFVRSRNTAALEMQRRILHDRLLNIQEFNTIVSSLVNIGSLESVQILIQEVLMNPASTEDERDIVLSGLKLVGADEWEGERYQMIKPYIIVMEKTMPGFRRSDHLLVRGDSFDMLIPKEQTYTLGPNEWIIDE